MDLCSSASRLISILLECVAWGKVWTGSKRGQQHNGAGEVGCSTTVWETSSHTKESKQRHRRGKTDWIKEIAIFSTILFCYDKFYRKHFLSTTGLLAKRYRRKIKPFRKLMTDIKLILAAVKNILCSVKNIFLWMKKHSCPVIGECFLVSHWLSDRMQP